jgi:hypothetical protein
VLKSSLVDQFGLAGGLAGLSACGRLGIRRATLYHCAVDNDFPPPAAIAAWHDPEFNDCAVVEQTSACFPLGVRLRRDRVFNSRDGIGIGRQTEGRTQSMLSPSWVDGSLGLLGHN